MQQANLEETGEGEFAGTLLVHRAQDRRLQCSEHGLGGLGLDTGLLDQVGHKRGLVENRLDGLDCCDMRCEEIAGIEVGAGRKERKEGLVYNWVQSIEHKTKKGRVEYLMPAVGHRVLKVMERWSAPLRQELQSCVLQLEANHSPVGLPERMRVLAAARADCNRLFLGRAGPTPQIRTVSGLHWAGRMKGFAAYAGVDWRLSPHQLRRAYAWTFVRHRLTINADQHPLMNLFHKPTDEKRMVVVLEPEQFDDWLQAPAARSMEFLQPFPADGLRVG